MQKTEEFCTSFINEQRLAAIYNEITEGDFLIQFGHNDAKMKIPIGIPYS